MRLRGNYVLYGCVALLLMLGLSLGYSYLRLDRIRRYEETQGVKVAISPESGLDDELIATGELKADWR